MGPDIQDQVEFIGGCEAVLPSATEKRSISLSESSDRVVRRGKCRGTGPAPSLERYEAGDVAAGGPR
jgi:hypothetical protein